MLFRFVLIFMYVGVLHVCLNIICTPLAAFGLQRPEESVGSTGNGVTNGYKLFLYIWNQAQVICKDSS